MTADRNFKRRVRARVAKTGESYTTALRHFRPTPSGAVMPESVRLAVAQSTERNDPTKPDELRAGGRELRELMRQAHQAGARIVHFTEGTIVFPSKLILSVDGPEKVGPSDWNRIDWEVLRAELSATADLARDLKLWTVLGSVHQLTPPNRPYNSLYVISDQGKVATRYDERTLSTTKRTYMYAAGSAPVTFEVDGLHFGCALGMDIHFPELYTEYERLDVDCVLTSTTGGVPHDTVGAAEVQGHAAANSYWISYAVTAGHSTAAPSGVLSPTGDWVSQCSRDGNQGLVVADLTASDLSPSARAWRRSTRDTIRQARPALEDVRTTTSTGF